MLGDVTPDEPVLVRVQTANLLRDVFGAAGADDDHPATVSLRMIEEAGKGILLYVFARERASMLAGLGGPAPAATDAPIAATGRRACATSGWARRCSPTWVCARSAC